jgi:hypothetical protein
MESWEKYERSWTPLPDSLLGEETGVRQIDLSEWEMTGTEEEQIFKGSLKLTQKEASGPLFLKICRAGCIAKVLEDGRLIGQHYGGFTDWEVFLSRKMEKERQIEICLKQDRGNISPFEKAGFHGKLFLISLPEIFIQDLSLDTDREQERFFLEAELKLAGRKSEENVQVCLFLEDGEGRMIQKEEQEISGENRELSFRIPCPGVELWETETPVRYRSVIQIWKAGNLMEQISRWVGFRHIEVREDQVFWNDRPLKLRGLCYREPLGKEGERFLRHDLELFQKAGVRYLRSLYYPFSEEALELCDELGILTEQSAVPYQVGREGRATQDLPDLREAYLGQFSEMLKASRNHVSVLLWNLGSESVWGNNFRLCAKMARKLAKSRLQNFSYPMTIPKEDVQMDVWSVLYADYRQPLDVPYDHMIIGHANGCENEIGYVTGHSRRGKVPVLHEIYAHLPCHNREEIRRDYGIHEFWGESICRFQKKMEETRGALGGSVMAAYDEDGSFSPLLSDYGWGILDADHEPKPEYYHLKMAFSGEQPKKRGQEGWNFPEEQGTGAVYEISEDEETICCQNTRMKVQVSKETGLLSGLWYQGEKLIEEGPFLHMEKLVPGEWIPKAPVITQTEEGLDIRLWGSYAQTCEVRYQLTLKGEGWLETAYCIDNLQVNQPPKVKAQIGLDPGGLDELGISYLLPVELDTLSWEREGLWETYPTDHIGRNQGTAISDQKKDFESMKHHVRKAVLSGKEKGSIKIFPKGTCSIRLKEEPKEAFVIDDRDEAIRYQGSWYQMDDAAGNRNGTETLSRRAGDSLEYTFQGTGIAVYGPTDHIGGLYRIWVDHQLISSGSSYPKPVDVLAASRGYEKMYQMPMAQIDGLSEGFHTLKVEVLGEKDRSGNDTFVSVDYLEVFDGRKSRQLRMMLNHGFNYTRLVRGNYMEEPVMIEPGKWFHVGMKLEGKENEK